MRSIRSGGTVDAVADANISKDADDSRAASYVPVKEVKRASPGSCRCDCVPTEMTEV